MDRAAHPVDRAAREAETVTLELACACGYAERWPWPARAPHRDVRATCPRCAGQLHEPGCGAPSADSAFEAAWSRDEDG